MESQNSFFFIYSPYQEDIQRGFHQESHSHSYIDIYHHRETGIGIVLTIDLIPVNPMKPVESWSEKPGFSFLLFFLVSSDAISLAEKKKKTALNQLQRASP